MAMGATMGSAEPASSPLARARGRLPGPPRYGILLAASVASIGVQGVSSPGPWQQVLVTALSGLALLLALRSAQVDPRLMRLAAVVAAAFLAASVVRAAAGGVGDGAARAMNAGLVAFGPPAVAVGVVRDLRATGRVRFQAVLGVLALYLLIGLFFAFVFGAIDRLGGAPVFAGGLSATVSRCIYFSFTTLATVGYGDVVTRSQLGHTLSISEALIGQIYLVTIVSLLVSNLAPAAVRSRSAAGTEADAGGPRPPDPDG